MCSTTLNDTFVFFFKSLECVNEELCSHQALLAARGWHSHQLRELPMTALSLSADDPALPTQIVEL